MQIRSEIIEELLSEFTEQYCIIGSYPLNIRESNDIDILYYKSDFERIAKTDRLLSQIIQFKGLNFEFLFVDDSKSLQELLNLRNELLINEYELAYILKKGHIIYPFRNINKWEKHIKDLHILNKIVRNPIALQELVNKHRKCTLERRGLATPKLIGTSKEDFFNDNVIKVYEHDKIHSIMAHKDKPMYNYMQKDNTVQCHKDLWDDFTHKDKIRTVLEESYVIALERHIIPTIEGLKIGRNSVDAFKWALMRICTTLCSGWFREFAIDNYYEILNNHNRNYVDVFKSKAHTITKINTIKNEIIQSADYSIS